MMNDHDDKSDMIKLSEPAFGQRTHNYLLLTSTVKCVLNVDENIEKKPYLLFKHDVTTNNFNSN